MRAIASILIILFLCGQALSSEGQTATSEEGIFSGSFADALWTVVAFLVLLAVLGKLAWKPLLNSLKARQEHIEKEIEAAEASRRRAEAMLDEYKQQGVQIIGQATEQAQQYEKEIEGKAHEEIETMRHRAHDEIMHTQAAASEQLWEQAADMILTLGSDILGRTITREDNERLIRQAVDKIKPR